MYLYFCSVDCNDEKLATTVMSIVDYTVWYITTVAPSILTWNIYSVPKGKKLWNIISELNMNKLFNLLRDHSVPSALLGARNIVNDEI